VRGNQDDPSSPKEVEGGEKSAPESHSAKGKRGG